MDIRSDIVPDPFDAEVVGAEDASSSLLGQRTADQGTRLLLTIPATLLVFLSLLMASGSLTLGLITIWRWQCAPVIMSVTESGDTVINANLRFRPLLWPSANNSSATLTWQSTFDENPSWHSELSVCPVLFKPTLHTSGMGDQLIAYALNLQLAADAGLGWLHVGLGGDAERWTNFLGLGLGEPDLPAAALQLSARPSNVVHIQLQSAHQDMTPRHVSDQAPLLRSLADALCATREARDLTLNASLTGPSASDHLWQSTQHRLLVVTGFSAYPWADPLPCSPQLYATLRQKYCLARLLVPLATEVTAALGPDHDGVLRVAVHYRGGDMAFAEYLNKRWLLSDLVRAMDAVQRALNDVQETGEFGAALQRWEFHIHSQSPSTLDGKPGPTLSWQEYFAPVIDHFNGSVGLLHWHIDTKSELTFYDLVRSPVLLRSESGFAIAASFLRSSGVDIISSQPPCWQAARSLQIDFHDGQSLSSHQLREQLRLYFRHHNLSLAPVSYAHVGQCRYQPE